jgi:phage shock protein C
MNKVITISLNGNAYQLEEEGCAALRAYLDLAREKLSGNPDAEEILRDLEGAIAEKLSTRMGPHRNVASTADVAAVLGEMGPVDGASNEGAAQSAAPKRLYRIEEDEMVFGVCTGLAAYFGVDVVLVRIAFVALIAFSGGAGGVLYVAMGVLVPKARTPEERAAAANGERVTAHDLMNRAREEYEKWDKNSWRARRRELKQQQRRARHQGRAWQDYPHGPGLVGETAQALFFALCVWAVYTYVPQTQPFFHHLWALFIQGWTWILGGVERAFSN